MYPLEKALLSLVTPCEHIPGAVKPIRFQEISNERGSHCSLTLYSYIHCFHAKPTYHLFLVTSCELQHTPVVVKPIGFQEVSYKMYEKGSLCSLAIYFYIHCFYAKLMYPLEAFSFYFM